jgi:hypothetical protein
MSHIVHSATESPLREATNGPAIALHELQSLQHQFTFYMYLKVFVYSSRKTTF